MGKVGRDDFLLKTKRILALRANNRCSLCDLPTSGPSNESSGAVINIGVAAHIHAAAPGGPRYLPEMSAEQRIHIENGIWLCANHGSEIDRDTVRYSAEVLRQLKADHESRVSAQLSGSSCHKSAIGDFLAIGTDIVAFGELISASDSEWTLRLESFLIGELATLIEFCENFARVHSNDRFILVNALGDGRQLAAAPAWRRVKEGYEVIFQIHKNFPRMNAHRLGSTMALDMNHDLYLDKNGSIARVSGLDSLPQKIQTCLSTLRGEVFFSPLFGSRLKEYFDAFHDSVWLEHLFKLEVIRLASVPYLGVNDTEPYTPFRCVKRVLEIKLIGLRSGDWLPLLFELDVEGVGLWSTELSIFVPQREPPQSVKTNIQNNGRVYSSRTD